jgi:hypothetical protein
MTKPFVFRDAVYHEAPYIKWVAENAAALLSKRPEIKEHGLWIVTSTYSTQLCMFNVWSAIDKKISLGFKVSAVNVGEIGPHGEWYEASSDEGWIRYESKEVRSGVLLCYYAVFTAANILAPGRRKKSSVLWRTQVQIYSGLGPCGKRSVLCPVWTG